MPTYIYKCSDNGHVFDLIQGFQDAPGADCPTCGGASTRKITAPTVIYKGSGFYTTDYGSGSATNKPKDASPGKKPDADAESDSKPKSSSSSSEKKASGTSGGTSARDAEH
jgi:putative FmdB family regulatory protein